MTIQTVRWCSMDDPATPGQEDFQFFITYDDVDMLARSVRILNNGTRTVQIQVRDGTTMAIVLTYSAQPNTDVTYNIPASQRPNIEQYSIACV